MQIQLVLDHTDVGQVLDALTIRKARWQAIMKDTQAGDSTISDDPSDDCYDAEEAKKISAHYERIIHSILDQLGQR